MNRRPLILILVIGILMALSFAGGYLTSRLGRVHVERVVGTTILNGNTPMVDIDELPSSLISPQTEIDGVEGSECLVRYGSGQRVEVGIIPFEPESDASGGDVAVWVKCLSGPETVDPTRRFFDFDPEQWEKQYPQSPDPGDRVRYKGVTWLGSGSDVLDVPDVTSGMTGTVLGLVNGSSVLVEWDGGPTFPVIANQIEPIKD